MTRGGEFAGMTVHERLHAAGLLKDFDAAIRAGDKGSAAGLLQRTGLSPAQARETVDAILRTPAKYGYPPDR